ncbi:MAG TPA: hypothetical protein VJN67_08125 [Stellaceae bacterium]|nr:hypothetical protein [Stellaceae bacterium]
MIAGKAGAEWRDLGDNAVWSDVGVLFEFRIARIRDTNEHFHTIVIDCDDNRYLGVLTGAQGEQMIDDDWFDLDAGTTGERVAKYACGLKFEKTGRWIAHVDPTTNPTSILGFDQWSQVGELGDLRLTWIQKNGSHDREVWFVRCADAAIVEVSSIESGKAFRINGRWKAASERAERAMVGYACGTCQSLVGFKCAPHDV